MLFLRFFTAFRMTWENVQNDIGEAFHIDFRVRLPYEILHCVQNDMEERSE